MQYLCVRKYSVLRLILPCPVAIVMLVGTEYLFAGSQNDDDANQGPDVVGRNRGRGSLSRRLGLLERGTERRPPVVFSLLDTETRWLVFKALSFKWSFDLS